jgi:tetratricopeptide (TPR) repeat protein
LNNLVTNYNLTNFGRGPLPDLSLQPKEAVMKIARVRPVSLALALVCLPLCGLESARGVEPAQAFLDGLRERKYFDVAAEYLDAAQASPNVPAQFKQTLLYEKGVTLIEGANFTRDSALREKQLDEGQSALQQFIGQQPNHILAMSARNQMANVLVKRAGNRVDRAKKLTAAEKQKVLSEALGLYDEAIKGFGNLVTELGEKLKSFPAFIDEKKEAKRFGERLQLRTDYLQAQLLVAATQEEKAGALPPDSKEQTEVLTKATDGYKEVYEKYRTLLAGLYARMYQGRCLHKLKKYKEASAIFNELLANPDAPEAFHKLKIKVMCLAVESWAAQSLFLEIVSKGVPVIDSLRPGEDRDEEVMGMRLTVAGAMKSYADEIKKTKPKDPQIKQLLTEGRKLVTYVTKYPGEHQDAARRLLADFTGGDADAVADRPEPKNFAEASTAAREAITAMQEAQQIMKLLPSRIATEKDAANKNEMQKQLDEATAGVAKYQEDAFYLCRLALKLADKESDLTSLNLIRYLLCYLHYQEGNYFDAVVIGEFLAQRYPDSQGARQCAKIAMASYLKLYTENKTDDKAYETARIIEICDYITRKWPDQPEAEEALNTLIPFMIREKKLKEAQDYLKKIPLESPHRGSAELKTGQALWASYLENSKLLRDWETGTVQKPDDVDIPARKQELEQLKSTAKETLVGGVERMRTAGDSGAVIATAVLSLTQIYVDTGEAAKAVALLEDPKIGSLVLVRAKDEATQKPGFPEETFKTALRAYISSLGGSAEASATVEKAKAVMADLKEYMGQDEAGKQKLVAIYVSLARDLQRQMEIAEPGAKSSLGQGFEAFLGQVAQDASELDVLNWVAETYRGMGESFLSADRKVSPEAKTYFEKAAATYDKIIDVGKKKQGFLAPAMATQIRLQQAKTKRSMLDYTGAMDIFEAILKASPTMLPVQIEAARTYQDWATYNKPDLYQSAMFGARPDKTNPDKTKQGKNVIWGWGEIGNRTAGDARFTDQFNEARFNLALCRYNYALSQKDAKKKTELLKRATQDISVTIGLYGSSVEDKWRTQYDTLLKNVQKGLGERPVGLQALEKKLAPSGTPVGGKTGGGKAAGGTAAGGKVAPAPAKVAPPSTKSKTK